ncbi:GNAT family N-acetyltransferase [Paenibacillus segetis]|uniref:N-acetyltransferase YvbK n=1 Tax=Paenibacillus segetis TaxID=1325360 RepID=A0ABQ1YJA6_9BACL|nr:GNAT family N-acetyltransferase [Paenibacillus segetis]GGH26971.1 putative N-acetyltransferase YvbK [Paenibacillus segetis]
MDLIIKKLTEDEIVPYDLLLLADPSKEIVDDYLHRGSCYIASLLEEIVGIFVLLRTRPETIEIVNVAVKEDFQNRGIGKRLVRSAIEKAKEEQVNTIEIGTGNSSILQLALYQKCGFRIVGVDQDFFVRHYDEEIFENGIQCRDMIRLRLEI